MAVWVVDDFLGVPRSSHNFELHSSITDHKIKCCIKKIIDEVLGFEAVLLAYKKYTFAHTIYFPSNVAESSEMKKGVLH